MLTGLEQTPPRRVTMTTQHDLYLRQVTPDDFDELYLMKSDEADVRASGFAAPPDRAKFRNWFQENLNGKERIMLLALNGAQEVVGYLYIRFTKDQSDFAEISYGVKDNFRGHGYGARMNDLALDYACKRLTALKYLVAWVAADNLQSVRSFQSIGYTDTGETKDAAFQLPSPHLKTMRKFTFDLSRRRFKPAQCS